MTDKIYVLTKGEYSDFRIFAMFSTKERAEKCWEEMRAIQVGYGSINESIEEWELDSIPELNGMTAYEVMIDMDSGDGRAEKIRNLYQFESMDECKKMDTAEWHPRRARPGTGRFVFRIFCVAEDEAHAIKTASERMAQEKALNRL